MTTDQKRSAKAYRLKKLGISASILRSTEDVLWLWDYNRNAIVEYIWGFPESSCVTTRYVYGGEAVGFYEVSSVYSEILGAFNTEGVVL